MFDAAKITHLSEIHKKKQNFFGKMTHNFQLSLCPLSPSTTNNCKYEERAH